MTFNELNLSAPVLRAVAQAGYESPSPIQAAAIPPVLAGRDLMGCAQTGTGKTAAFALPMLDRLTASAPRKKGAIRALILTPTRELALQIGESFEAYGKYLTLRSTVIFGGVGQAPQVAALKKGVDILIACPGRLNDLVGQGLLDLSNIEIFVLDEADRMLDMGFVHDVKKVIAKLPRQRQNLMFSATMPKEIEQLAAGILHDPAFVKVDPVSSTVDRIQQSLYFVEKGNKKFLLPWLIKNLKPEVVNALVFSRTKHGADKIAKDLNKQGIPAAAIHGNKSQTARVTALEDFKAGKTRVLVATDIAARGIDISELSHVFNYDLPEVPETYVHRIGRTARAGADGTAVSFCAPEEKEYLAGIEKLNRRQIPVVSGHPWDGVPAPVKAAPPVRGKKPKAEAEQPEKPVKAEKPAKAEKAAKAEKPAVPAELKVYAPAEPGSREERIEIFIKGLLEHMGSDAVPHAVKTGDDTYLVDLVGENLGILIGRRGETLDAIQHLTNYAVNRGSDKHMHISVDAESYRAKREESLVRLAEKMAAKAIKYKRSMALEPMNSYERHVIHTALQDYKGVTTSSTGTEPNRRVVVSYEKPQRPSNKPVSREWS